MTLTAIRTGLNPDLKPSIQIFRDWAYIMDGDNIPIYMDQNAAIEWMHLDPTTAITADEAQAGSLPDGVYQYFYTEAYKPSGDGDIHSCHETNPSPIYTTGILSSKKVVLTLPGTARNTGFTHLKIYGTAAGGSIFYYLYDVPIGTTTYEDNNTTRDSLLVFGKVTESASGTQTQTYLNYSVSNHRYVLATKTRLLTFGIRDKSDGTVSVNNASTAVTGVDTLWTRALVGSVIYFNGESRGYEISAVGSATGITLSENYAGGSNLSGVSYVITGDDSLIKWTAKHPITAKPMPWAFPTDHYRRIRRADYTELMGGGLIGDQPVVFKKYSHYMLTENGDDFIDTESNTKVGTCSHLSIVSIPDSGYLVFLSYEGRLYKTNGVEAIDMGVNLNETEDGFNTARKQYVEARWDPTNKFYLLTYSSQTATINDKMLCYDWKTQEYTIFDFDSNCLAIVESTEDSLTVLKPWFGSVNGFIYKMFTGNNFGASSGTLSGTATGFGADTLTDTGASFYNTDDGLKDVPVQLYNTAGVFQEERKISSNTGTIITVDTAWTSSPQAGWLYEIGGIRWHWKSKTFHTNNSFTLRNVLLRYKKVASSRNVDVKFYISEDADIASTDTAQQTITFDFNNNYYVPLSCYDNRGLYFRFVIEGHGTNDPVEINAIIIDFMEHLR